MSNHGLTRNADNDPVCLCGYYPAVLNEAAPVGKQWKARTAVLDHAQALNNYEAKVEALAAPVTPPTPLRSPDAPFNVHPYDVTYPAGRCPADRGWSLAADLLGR